MSVHPEKIEKHKRDRHIRYGRGEQICGVILPAEALLQIEEGQPSPFVKSDDFAINNYLLIKPRCLFNQFGKLRRNSSQIARENLDSLSAAVKLGADPIKLVFNI